MRNRGPRSKKKKPTKKGSTNLLKKGMSESRNPEPNCLLCGFSLTKTLFSKRETTHYFRCLAVIGCWISASTPPQQACKLYVQIKCGTDLHGPNVCQLERNYNAKPDSSQLKLPEHTTFFHHSSSGNTGQDVPFLICGFNVTLQRTHNAIVFNVFNNNRAMGGNGYQPQGLCSTSKCILLCGNSAQIFQNHGPQSQHLWCKVIKYHV